MMFAKLLATRLVVVACGTLFLWGSVAASQTLATGDSRTVTEPTFPVTCSTLTAQQAIVSGGPASETLFDTSRIQTALTACPAGQAVELVGAGGNFAFLIAPLNIPSGVGLIVDGGVTVFASRNPADYQVTGGETCGSYGNGGGCNNLFKFGNGSTNVNSGLYGYGVIDGRGWSTMLTATGADTGISWWQNADTATTAGKSQDNFIFMKPSKSTNLILYKITLRNSPMFHVVTSGVNGLTVWGVKIQAPFSAHNTDGIDPQGTNVTINNSSISDGDDDVAVSASSASSNVTVSNTTTYSGHGISVGSYTSGGLNNMLVKNVNMAGTAADGNSIGLRLKSAADRGGLVQNITYQNVCIRDTRYPIVLTGYYNTNGGTQIPTFSNVVYQSVHALPPTGTQYPYKLQFQGYDANHLSTVTLNNVSIETLLASNVVGTTSFAPSYTTFALANNVYPAFLTTLTGTGVTETGAATTNVAANTGDCTATSTIFPYIIGELFATTTTATNLQNATVASGGTVVLNAMVQPAMSQTSFSGTAGNSVGATALAAGVDFYLGTTKVGSGALNTTANGTIASLSLTSPAAGTYTAQYQGDAKYPPIVFGSVNITVPTGAPTTDSLVINPATITYGAYPTLTSTVTAAAGTPTGSITYNEGSKSYAGGMLSANTVSTSTILFTAGNHTLTSTYSGGGTYSTSTSAAMTLIVNQAATTTAVTAAPTTVTANGMTSLSVTVTGSSNSAAALPSGTVSFADGGTSLGSVNLGANGTASLPVTLTTAGSRTITATYNGDTNYMASSGNAAVTVNSAASTTVLTVPATFAYGVLPTLSATVTASSGTPPASPSGAVAFYDGSTLLGSGTLTSGVATFALTTYLAGGTHMFSAVYGADMTYATSTGTATATVTVASTSTSLTPGAVSITAGGQVTYTVTVTGVPGAASPSGKVTFADNGTTLGTATLAGGTAMYAATLSTPGSHTVTGTYAGDTNYAMSSSTSAATVTPMTTTTVLTAASPTIFAGGQELLSAQVIASGAGAPAISVGAVSFYNGSTLLGTVNVSGGVAVYTLTAATVGTVYSLTAVYAATGPYAGSTSAATAVTVGYPTMLTANPATLSIAAGSSGTTSLSVAGANGYTGAATLACSTTVKYVTCSVANTSVVLSGTTAQTVVGTVTVAATTAANAVPANGTVFAMMMPAGLVGLLMAMRRRRFVPALLAAVLLCVTAGGMAGCGSSTPATVSNKPTGSYVVMFTSTAAGTVQSTAVTVNIQ